MHLLAWCVHWSGEFQTDYRYVLQSKKVTNTGLKSALRVVGWYAYCLGYLHFTSWLSEILLYPLFTAKFNLMCIVRLLVEILSMDGVFSIHKVVY